MKITRHVYLVGGSSESHASDAAIYLVKGDGEAALIDAGTGKGHARVLKNIEEAGVGLGEVTRLFITHCHYDHTGGAELMRQATGCRIVSHALDADFLQMGDSRVTAASWYGEKMEPTRVDLRVEGGEERFSVGGMELAFYHAPGHSPGSAVLTLVSDGLLVLFGQDVHGPLNDVLLSSRGDYVRSLEFLLSLEADVLCEGHFGVFAGKEKVREFIESFL
jgi:glyoxylase-like metal-dependent hydrolase (beta-lactamase superfamily II)